MLYLSLSALKYAANICEEFPKYKIGIALRDISDSKSIIDILKVNIEDIGVKISMSKYNPRIEFSNGSSIKFISASDNLKGFALNLLIVEYGIDREIINCVLRTYEKVDYYKIHNINVKLNKKDNVNEM